MYHKWKHKVTTDWFCNFLRNLHWALKMTTDWFWNFLGNQHLSQMRTQSHYIVFSVFLETSTKPPTQSTVWFIFFLQNLNQDFSIFFLKPRSLQIGSAIFLEINTEHRKWLQIGFEIFLEINIWHFEHTKSLQIRFSVFLETSTKPPTKSTVWFIIFLAKTEWALF